MVEPMSGSFITRKQKPPRTRITGFTTRRQSVDLGAAAAHEIGGVQEERELGELARLEAHEVEAEPAPRARDVDADAGHEHDHEQRGAGDHQGRDELLPAPVVDAHADDERDDAEHGPDELAEEEVPRRPVVGERRDRRRRQHHDHADDVEHHDDREQQHRVRRSRRPSPIAAPVPAPAHDGASRSRTIRSGPTVVMARPPRAGATSRAKSSPRAA